MGYRSALGTLLTLLSLTACDRVLPVAQSGAIASPTLQVQTITQPNARIHLVTIPVGQGFRVIAAADRVGVQQLSAFAAADGAKAIAIINGGYFDPKNRQTTAFVTAQGQLLLDPRQNKDLMANANVAPYMAQILNRSEFRHYRCGPIEPAAATPATALTDRYDITAHNAPLPPGCQLSDGLGAGPQLLPNRSDEADALYIADNGRVIRDPIGRDRPNARSAVAITADGSLLLAMVSQLPNRPAESGMTLTELAAFLKAQGAIKALNLDGGTSSSLWVEGKSDYGQFDDQGEPMKRPVKSVLMVVR